ncbi:MAG: hypothetical protein NC548_61565 [Lachnospiraceae bacterium]|nr:hypothetical protein [Lachnospiraceae bacterium]
MSTPCFCGECNFLLYEDMDGNGYCQLQDCVGRNCSDQCDLDHTAMRTDCLLKGLHYLQKWRRGADTKQPMGYVVGKMIDSVIYKLRQSK